MYPTFEPRDPDYEQKVRESFAKQGLLATFCAELRTVTPGMVEIEVPFSRALTQQDDFFHAASASPYWTARAAMPRCR